MQQYQQQQPEMNQQQQPGMNQQYVQPLMQPGMDNQQQFQPQFQFQQFPQQQQGMVYYQQQFPQQQQQQYMQYLPQQGMMYLQPQYVGQPMMMQPSMITPTGTGQIVQQTTTTTLEKTLTPTTVVQQPVSLVVEKQTVKPKLPPPINQNLVQAMKLVTVEQAAKDWLNQRMEIIGLLEDLICALDKKQKSTAKAKVGGTATNIVGASLIVGGLVAAPFTLGGSLLATTAGLGCVGAGTSTSIIASVVEWKHAKKSAKKIQNLLTKDTESVNSMVKKIYEYRVNDPDIESRTITIGSNTVGVVQFVDALTGYKNQGLDQSEGFTNGVTGIATLGSLMIKGAIPIISIPVDMVILVEESKKAHGKQPSKLAAKLTPIFENIKEQTSKATGVPLL